MPSTSISRIDGLTTSVAVKAPIRIMTSSPITMFGEQTINSVTPDGTAVSAAVVSGDRVGVNAQVDQTMNGIWIVSSSAWRRALDFDGALDAVHGTLVIDDGPLIWRLTTQNPVQIGTSLITFETESGFNQGTAQEVFAAISNISGAIKTAGAYNVFSQNAAADVLFIGDSNGAGAGQAGGFIGGYMARVARSLMNAFDKTPGVNRGYMYYAWLNGYQQLLSEGGWSQSGGTAVTGGPAGSAWRMPSGAWTEKTGVEASQGKVFFAPSTDGSTMQVTVNGVVATNFTVNANGLSLNFGLAVGGAYIRPSDKVRFTCTSGSIDVYGFRLMRAGGSNGPIVYCSPEGSQSFSDYTETSRSALLARYVNDDQPSAPKLICCFLGTNNMITAAGKQKTPADMVADMQAFVTRYRTLIPNCYILFWVPPRPRADVFLPYGPYEDYVGAEAAFVATQSNVGLVRMDLSGVEGSDAYADPDPVPGVHLNSAYHAATAKVICSYLGIAVDTSSPGFAEYPQHGSNANGNWVRHADGTQECWFTKTDASVAVDVAFFGGFRSAAVNWTFPVEFAAAPTVEVTIGGLTAFGAANGTPTTTVAPYHFTSVTTSTSAGRTAHLYAAGYWRA